MGCSTPMVGLNFHQPTPQTFSGGLVIARGDGAGGFSLLSMHSLPVAAAALVAADFDGDGFVDVAELGGYPVTPTISLAFGVGDGSFVNGGGSLNGGLYAAALCAGDWDGDGDVDLAAGNKYNLITLVNDGAASFTNGPSVSMGYYVKAIATADLDGDGDLDLAATSGGSSVIRMLANNGNGQFGLTASVPATSQCYAVLLVDTNGDGFDDPWAVDVSTGRLSRGTSHCFIARYGQAKQNSAGCLPEMDAVGRASISGSGFAVEATNLLPSKPAYWVIGLSPQEIPLFGGLLLVQGPWTLLPTTTTAGSGGCAGTVYLPIGGGQLAQVGIGTQVYVQVLSWDPFQIDGTNASLSDGLRFEIEP